MDVYRLVRDELEYELIVRVIDGDTAGTVLSMRNVQECSESVALRIEARLHHIFGRINRLNLIAADNLVVSIKIKDLLGYLEEFEELFDDKRTAITKSRHETSLETEQEDQAS
ncbi:hypothetical protein FQA39_LY15334 [Lamprigera yunnana]|nr:hypothetical protein FQA39_LY15334 [Lamprigera yunnana]